MFASAAKFVKALTNATSLNKEIMQRSKRFLPVPKAG
jgi:uncharacterized protein YwgA